MAVHQHQPMLNLKCTATLALHSNFVYTFYASNYRLQRTVSFLIFHSATMCARCCGHHTKSTNNSIYVTLERKFHFVPFRSVRLNQINMTIQAQILRRHTPTPLLLTANAMYLISHSTIVVILVRIDLELIPPTNGPALNLFSVQLRCVQIRYFDNNSRYTLDCSHRAYAKTITVSLLTFRTFRTAVCVCCVLCMRQCECHVCERAPSNQMNQFRIEIFSFVSRSISFGFRRQFTCYLFFSRDCKSYSNARRRRTKSAK